MEGSKELLSTQRRTRWCLEYQEDTHSKGEEPATEVLRKKNEQSIFWIMKEQNKFQAERSSLTGIRGIQFVSHFWPHVPVAPAGLSDAQQVNLTLINGRKITQGRRAVCSALPVS